jgi:DNA gyrase/topoisomerase IV subunit A
MTEANLRAAELEGLEKRFKMTATMSTTNMVCFDLNGKIRKYTSPEEILIDFYHKRLEFYGLRKVSHETRLALNDSNTSQMSSTGNSSVSPIKPDSFK